MKAWKRCLALLLAAFLLIPTTSLQGIVFAAEEETEEALEETADTIEDAPEETSEEVSEEVPEAIAEETPEEEIVLQEEEDIHVVTFDANGGVFSDEQTLSFFEGTTDDAGWHYPENPTREGYRFLGWAEDLESDEPSSEIWTDFSRDCTYYAVWEESPNYIILHANGGCFDRDPSKTEIKAFYDEDEGGYIDLDRDYYTPEVTDFSQAFVGWARTSDSTEAEFYNYIYVYEEEVTELYAVWTPAYKVTFVSPDITIGKWTVDGEDTDTFEKAVIADEVIYTDQSFGLEMVSGQTAFVGWSRTEGATEPEDSSTIIIDGPTTLYAVFAPKTQVTFNLNGGYCRISYNSEEEEIIDQFTLYLRKNEYYARDLAEDLWRSCEDYNFYKDGGYTFIAWSRDSDATTEGYEQWIDITDEEETFYAIWDQAVEVQIHSHQDATSTNTIRLSQTLKEQGFFDRWDTDDSGNRIFLLGYDADQDGIVDYGPNDRINESVTDLYEIWGSSEDAGYTNLMLNDEYSENVNASFETWYTFTPDEDGAYTFKFTSYDCGIDAFRVDSDTDSYVNYEGISTWVDDTFVQYVFCEMEAGKKYYLNTNISLSDKETPASYTVVVEKAGKVVYHLNEEETETEIVPVGQYPNHYVQPTSEDPTQSLEGWAYTPNASKEDIIDLYQLDIVGGETIELYPVWETIGENAIELSVEQEQGFSVSPEGTWFSFVPQETRSYVLQLKKNGGSTAPYVCDGNLEVRCYSTRNDVWCYDDFSHEREEDASFVFNDRAEQLCEGSTYYFKVIFGYEDAVDWTISVVPATLIELNSNGGKFSGGYGHVAGLPEGVQYGFVFPGGGDKLIMTPDPSDGSNQVFAGWSTDINAVEPDADLSGEGDISWIEDHQTFYAVWQNYSDIARPLTKDVPDVNEGIEPYVDYMYSFVPESSGDYAFKYNNRHYVLEVYDENHDQIWCHSDGRLHDTDERYEVLEGLEADKTYYIKISWDEENFSGVGICTIVDAYKTTFHAGAQGYFIDWYSSDEEKVPTYTTYFIQGEQVFSIYNDYRVEIPRSYDPDYTLAGWSMSENAMEIDSLSQYEVNGESDFYAVWENYRADATPISLEEEYSIALTAKNQHFAFTPQIAGDYVLHIEQKTPYTPTGLYWFHDGSLRVKCLDAEGHSPNTNRSTSGMFYADIFYVGLEAGQTYYYMISDDANPNNEASVLQIMPVKHITTDANGGTFWDGSTVSDEYVYGDQYTFDRPSHPQEGQGLVFAGWSTAKNATEPNIHIEDPASLATLNDGDIIYAVWVQGIKVTFKTDVGEWYSYDTSAEPITEIVRYYAPGSHLYDQSYPSAINHPDGLQHEYGFRDEAGNTYYPNSIVDKELTLYPLWQEVITLTLKAGNGTFNDGQAEVVFSGVEKGTYLSNFDYENRPTSNDDTLIFAGWSYKENGGADDILPNSTKLEQDTELYAVYLKKIHVTLSVNDPEGGYIGPVNNYYDEDPPKLTVADLATWEGATFSQLRFYYDFYAGYVYDGPSHNIEGTQLIDQKNYKLQDGETIYIIFAKGFYIGLDGNGGTWNDGIEFVWPTVHDGQTIQKAIDKYGQPKKTGYYVSGWVMINEDGTQTPVTTDTVLENPGDGWYTLRAQWKAKTKNTISQTSTYGRSYSTKKQTIQLAKTAKYEKAGLTYKSDNKSVTVNSKGLVTIPAKFKGGKVTITITSKETARYLPVTKKVTIYVPTKPTISSAKNSASKTMKVTWKKASVAQGYQVQYSTSSKFKKAKTVTVKKQATVKATIKKLTKGKKYYVRVRSYYTVSSKKYYSAWSATKTVTIKK